MAVDDTSIDKLTLDIEVKDNNSAAKIRAVASAIDKLKVSLAGLQDVNKQLNKLTAVFREFNKGIKVKVPDNKLEQQKVTTDTETGLGPNIGKRNKSMKDYFKSFIDWRSNLKKSSKDMTELEKKWSKFNQSIGRIALYRAIRAALKGIVNAAKTGFENIRSVNKEFDKTLNQLSASGTSLQNSFAMILKPLIEGLTPLITRLSDGIANIVNRFVEAKAKTQGLSTYTKILTSDTEEYQKALDKVNGSLLSFDTFTTLGNNQQGYTGVKEEDVSMTQEEAEDVTGQLEKIKGLVIGIASAFALWKITGLLSDLSSMKVLLGTGVKGIGIFGIILGVVETIQGIKDLVKNWDIFTPLERFLKILKVVLYAAGAVFSALAFVPGMQWAIGAAAAALAGGAAISIAGYANGGSFNSADMFYANENGKTELIASTNNGGAVMNMEQLQGAIYNGMIMAMADSGGKEVTLKVDQNVLGRVVAQSPGFINETNRRNSGIKLI